MDASGLAVVGLGATGIVAAIGEAEGGSPYNGDTPIHRISNPGKVGRTFRDGDLREVGNMLFDPSKDPDVPAGAQEVKFVKVNPATQSAKTFNNADGPALTLTSKDYGLFTTQIAVDIADGTTQGKAITITFGDTVETYDDIGGDPAFTALYTPGAIGANVMTMDVDNAVGVTADFTDVVAGLQDTDTVSEVRAIDGLDGDKLNNITPGNVVRVVSANAGDTTQTATIVGIDSGSGLPATETLVLNGTTPVVGTTTWTTVHGYLLDSAALGATTISDGATPLYVIPAGQTVTGGGIFDFGGEVLEVGGGTSGAGASASVESDGASTQVIILAGRNAAGTPTLEAATLTGTTPVTTATTWSEIWYIALGYFEAAQDLTWRALQWNEGAIAQVQSNNAADTTQTITLYGLDGSNQPQTEVLTLNGTTLVSGTATWNRIHGGVLSALTTGTLITVQSGGNATITFFEFDGSASLYVGFQPVDNIHVSNSAITALVSGATVREVLAVGLDATGAAQVVAVTADGTLQSPTETWSELTGWAVGHITAARNVNYGGEALNLPVGTYETVQEVADFINTKSGWTITIGPNAGPLLVSGLDNAAAVSVLTAAQFTADLGFIVTKLTEESQLVTPTIPTGATGAPDNTTASVFLVGGIEGVTTFADWQAALDLLRDEFVNTVVPLTDDAAVHAAAVTHAAYMGGPGRKERDVVLGEESGITFANAKAAAVALNTRHARLCIQDIERFNVAGEEETFPPYFTAAIAAGMQAGSPVGTSLTFKFANVLDVIGDDATYTLQDDANELIQSGLCVLEKVQGIGFRWLRNVTTYLIDNNLAFTEASVNEAVNFAVFNLRTNLEFAVGKKAFAGTANAAASVAVATLGLMIDAGAIVAWQNLTIEIEADVMTVDVEIAPVLPVNFVKTTVHLVTASFSAAA